MRQVKSEWSTLPAGEIPLGDVQVVDGLVQLCPAGGQQAGKFGESFVKAAGNFAGEFLKSPQFEFSDDLTNDVDVANRAGVATGSLGDDGRLHWAMACRGGERRGFFPRHPANVGAGFGETGVRQVFVAGQPEMIVEPSPGIGPVGAVGETLGNQRGEFSGLFAADGVGYVRAVMDDRRYRYAAFFGEV